MNINLETSGGKTMKTGAEEYRNIFGLFKKASDQQLSASEIEYVLSEIAMIEADASTVFLK